MKTRSSMGTPPDPKSVELAIQRCRYYLQKCPKSFWKKKASLKPLYPSNVSLKPVATIIWNKKEERKKYPRRPPAIHVMKEVIQQSQK